MSHLVDVRVLTPRSSGRKMPQLTLRRLDCGLSPAIREDHTFPRYAVEGLPSNQRITFFRFENVWRMLRSIDDVSDEWEGEYSTAVEALEALQSEFSDKGW